MLAKRAVEFREMAAIKLVFAKFLGNLALNIWRRKVTILKIIFDLKK